VEFDLMGEKPKLDIPTLNFIWDELWRLDFVDKPKNEHKRGEHAARLKIMERLQELANEVTSK
jgi:hypothetical protein